MKTLMIDFDGVLSHYDGNFREGQLGEPNPGALEAVKTYIENGFSVVVHTTRARDKAGHDRVRYWLADHGFDALVVPNYIKVTAFKVPAVAYLDDRAITFKGEWPAASDLEKFKPYWETEVDPDD